MTNYYKKAQQTPDFDPNQIKMFVTQLKQQTNTLASNLNNYVDPSQALAELQQIQTLTQQIIASIHAGARKTMVTPQQQIQQTRQMTETQYGN